MGECFGIGEKRPRVSKTDIDAIIFVCPDNTKTHGHFLTHRVPVFRSFLSHTKSPARLPGSSLAGNLWKTERLFNIEFSILNIKC